MNVLIFSVQNSDGHEVEVILRDNWQTTRNIHKFNAKFGYYVLPTLKTTMPVYIGGYTSRRRAKISRDEWHKSLNIDYLLEGKFPRVTFKTARTETI